jgi:hypothetical protein
MSTTKSPQPVFGLWTTAPLASAGSVAFDTSVETTSGIPPDVPVWRVNLPVDLNLAAAYLTEGEARLETSRKTMKEAPDLLDAFIRSQSVGPTFDVSLEGENLAKPEMELLVLINEIQAGRAPVSFGLGKKPVGGWQQATDRFQAFVDQLMKSIAHYAWVETCIQEQCLGRTGVGWTGDTNTVWRQGLNTEQVELHRRTLTLALESRDTLIRTFVVAARGAVQLSILLTVPTRRPQQVDK